MTDINKDDYKEFGDAIDWDAYNRLNNIDNDIQPIQDNSYNQNVNIGSGAQNQSSGQPPNEFLPSLIRGIQQLPGLASNAAQHPLSSMQDVGAGVMGGAQRLAAGLGEAGQAIGDAGVNYVKESFTGKPQAPLPKVNIREQLGLEGNNQVDLKELLASKNNNPLMKNIGQYGMGAGLGGVSLPSAIAANAGWSAIQAEPGERTHDALEGAGFAALPFAAKGIFKGGKAVINYAKPQADAEALLSEIGGGSTTAEENLDQLTKRIKYAHDVNVADALGDKQPVMDIAGKMRVDQLPGFNLEKVAKVFTKDPNAFTPESAKAISGAVKQYYKDGNLEKFTDKAEDIFGTEATSPKQIDAIENMLSQKESNYLAKGNAQPFYDAETKAAHDAFLKHRTFETADALQSKLGEEQAYYNRSGDRVKSTEFKLARDYLKKDLNGFLKGLSPELQTKYKSFSDKWVQNVLHYKSSNTLKAIVKKGNQAGITPGQITKEFEYPDASGKKIAEDIGQSGKNNILFNKVRESDTSDASKLANAIMKAKRGGYQHYVSPRHEQIAHELTKRAKAGQVYETAKGALGGAALGALIPGGHTVGGAIVGGIARHAPTAIKYVAKHLKK